MSPIYLVGQVQGGQDAAYEAQRRVCLALGGSGARAGVGETAARLPILPRIPPMVMSVAVMPVMVAIGFVCPNGVMSKARVKRLKVAGSGLGPSTIRSATRMASHWGSWGTGGAVSTIGLCPALMGFCWWWSLAMATWSSQADNPRAEG